VELIGAAEEWNRRKPHVGASLGVESLGRGLATRMGLAAKGVRRMALRRAEPLKP
jgi:hypothetical protein